MNTILVLILWALSGALAQGAPGPTAATRRVPQLDFLDERLRIPESELFDEGAYIESGVGLKFGVEQQLTYFPGDYAEAAGSFEAAVRAFPLKAEIWVYLARAYFYTKSPQRARQTLRRAEAVMPDLSQRLWQPLITSLEDSIRRRARQQRAQVEFYTASPDEVLSLFRLYLFLQDHDDGVALVALAYERARGMRERAAMVSGHSRQVYLEEGQRWEDLGDRLTGELAGIGVELPAAPSVSSSSSPSPAPSVDLVAQERIRILQLRVDYYDASIDEYGELFQAYLDRGDSLHAGGVVTALTRLIGDVTARASVAATASEQVRLEDEAADYARRRGLMRARLTDRGPTP